MVNKMDTASETMFGISSWMLCSVGMMVFNKLAIQAFPMECTLVALQMSFAALMMLVCCWRSLHVGSMRDVLRWSMVVPFYTGMLLTSILALKHAPMTLVVVFRVASPLVSLMVERFYPEPLRISPLMVLSMGLMFTGACMYTMHLPRSSLKGIEWVLLNIFLAVGDRLLQRLMLAKDQCPVDISKTGVTLLNNFLGMVPLLLVAFWKKEFAEVPAAVAKLDATGMIWVSCSCVVGVGISYCGIWAQSLISATSFLVLVNANKFAIIFLEAFIIGNKTLTPMQWMGASVTILAGIGYGKARELVEADSKNEKQERQPILAAAQATSAETVLAKSV